MGTLSLLGRGPSLSALLGQFRYSPLRNSDVPDSPVSPLPNDSPKRLTFRQLITSRRARLVAFFVFVAAIVLFAPRLYDSYSLSSSDVIPPSPDKAAPPLSAEDDGDDYHEGSELAAVDWSRFAYTQYVTNSEYLCNSVMLFETLHRLHARADRVMMYPSRMMATDMAEGANKDQKLLIKARDEYDVKLVPIEVQHKDGREQTWADSYTKLLVFNQTQYERVLNLDSDATVLQPMDELFLAPPAPVAMPRAYWLLPDKRQLSSQLLLVQPSATEFARVMASVENSTETDFDMDIVSDMYLESALVLPHRPYDLLTAEFRAKDDHHKYLGSGEEKWDPVAAFNEAKFLHFSDWPVPKPWRDGNGEERRQRQPACRKVGMGPDADEDCTERDMWNGFYEDFKDRRARVCATDAGAQGAGRWRSRRRRHCS